MILYMRLLKTVALAGNILIALWVIYNGIDEGFASIRTVQSVVMLCLLLLLVLNTFLIWRSE